MTTHLATIDILAGNQVVHEISIADDAADTWLFAWSAFRRPDAPVVVVGPDDIVVSPGGTGETDSIQVIIPGAATRGIPPGRYTVHLTAQAPSSVGSDWLARGTLTVTATPLDDDLADIDTILTTVDSLDVTYLAELGYA